MLVRVHRYPVVSSGVEELFDTFDREFSSFFDGFQGTGLVRTARQFPTVDIAEYENESVIVAELPGVARENLKISLEDDVLTISGERKPQSVPENSTWVRNEVRTGSFSRTIQLPHNVNRDGVAAELKDGLLKIVLPKSEDARPHEIKVQ